MKMRPLKSTSGFTLFELMLAMTILSVVSTIGASGFFKITSQWNELLLTQRLNESATRAFSEMAGDFENILPAHIGGVGLRGQHADTEDNERFWRLAFEDDRIALPVEYQNPVTGTWQRYLVRYEIDRSADAPFLVRTVRALNSDTDHETRTSAFPGITGMRIHYFDGSIWRSQWERDDMPAAVRVSVSVMDGMRADKHLARMASFRIFVTQNKQGT